MQVNILVVDDTPDNLRLLTEILHEQEYEVSAFSEGNFALEAARLNVPDLILLDIRMPGMDGYQVCTQLKADPRTRDIPVIFISALSDLKDEVKGFEIGGVDYITKPFRPEEVNARVKAHLTVRKLQQQLEHANSVLEQRVLQRTADLRNINAALQKEIIEHKYTEEALRKSEERFRLFFERNPEYCYMISPEGIILDINQAALQELGYQKHEMIGQPLQMIYAPDSLAEVNLLFETWKKTGTLDNEEVTIITRGGAKRTVLLSAVSVRDEHGRLLHSISSQHDITKRKQAEHELEMYREHLEELVKERTQELQHTLDELHAMQTQLVYAQKMAALGQLVAGIAHEINTPVGVGITGASYLKDTTQEFRALFQTDRMTKSRLEEYLNSTEKTGQMILASLQRVAKQVRSFKQIAAVQHRREKRKFDLKTYINDVLLSLRPNLTSSRHTILFECPEGLQLDSYPDAFTQLLTHLIMNSLTHGFEDISHGVINIKVTDENISLQIYYRDNGRGMTPEERHHLFEPFYTTKRGQRRTGLGMYIVFNLVTHTLNGQIECQSNIGEGTSFIIQIPRIGADNENS